MIHVGIDPSTEALACVALSGDEFSIRTYSLQGKDITARVGAAHKASHRMVDYFMRVLPAAPLFVAIEAPVAVKGRQTLIKMSQVSGAVIAALVARDEVFGIVQVPPSTWKKEVVGKGNVNKQQVGEWVRDEWPEFHRRSAGDQDALDASCIARYARAVDSRVGHLRLA